MELQYFGWSGVAIRRGTTLVGFDLFGEAVTWAALGDAETIILCVTHGHPEHVGSLRQFLAAPEARAHLPKTHLVSSPKLVAYVTRGGGRLPASQAHSLQDGEAVRIAGVEVAAFRWAHAPLLPSGLGAKGTYLRKLVAHPLVLADILLRGLRVPRNAPRLGFRVGFADGIRALNYSEGMHPRTEVGEVEAVARRLPAEVLLFAVEPENTAAIPSRAAAFHPQTVVLYEAHRHWRDLFGLPVVDLMRYAEELSAAADGGGVRVLTEPGQRVVVDGT